MKSCPACQHYNHGQGTKACLKCKRYADVQKASFRRSAVRIMPVPQVILEAIPDPETEQSPTDEVADFILNYVNRLPIREAIVILAYYKGGITEEGIASELGISRRRVREIRAAGIAALRAVLGTGD